MERALERVRKSYRLAGELVPERETDLAYQCEARGAMLTVRMMEHGLVCKMVLSRGLEKEKGRHWETVRALENRTVSWSVFVFESGTLRKQCKEYGINV